MANERSNHKQLSGFLKYLAATCQGESDRLPSLVELSSDLELSVASLREQLEVAKALGLVEVRPKTGIRRLPYTFRPAVINSLAYAITVDPDKFKEYSDLRNHLETAYWREAVALLDNADHQYLQELVSKANGKLHGRPVQIPYAEHREFHLAMYRRLQNPFVYGLLEGYWDLYEAFGFNVYANLNYLEQVWQYHKTIVESLISGDIASGYKALIDHMELINQRKRPASRQKFE
jgi:DNA-binding FadR family transcriptional regulator